MHPVERDPSQHVYPHYDGLLADTIRLLAWTLDKVIVTLDVASRILSLRL